MANYRLQATIARQQFKIYYYSINFSANGGVVVASSYPSAVSKLNAVYPDAEDIQVWCAEEDPHWDAKHPDVHERY